MEMDAGMQIRAPSPIMARESRRVRRSSERRFFTLGDAIRGGKRTTF